MQLAQRIRELQEHEKELDKHLGTLEVQKDLLKKDKNYAAYAYLTKADLEGLINSKFANRLSQS